MVLAALELIKRMATDLEFRDRLNGLTDKRELLERSGFDSMTAADIAPAAAGLFRGVSDKRGVTTTQIEFQSETAPQFAASSAAAIGCVAVAAIRFGQPVAGAGRHAAEQTPVQRVKARAARIGALPNRWLSAAVGSRKTISRRRVALAARLNAKQPERFPEAMDCLGHSAAFAVVASESLSKGMKSPILN